MPQEAPMTIVPHPLCWPFTLSVAIRWQSRYESARIWARM